MIAWWHHQLEDNKEPKSVLIKTLYKHYTLQDYNAVIIRKEKSTY